MAKKKRSEPEAEHVESKTPENEETSVDVVNEDSHKKKKEKKKHKREKEDDTVHPEGKPTVTIVVAGSIIDNTQSLELATRLAGQIARAATIFRIDEVVVFDNKSSSESDSGVTTLDSSDENESGAAFLTRILRYLETPQYLRRTLFPKHSNLRFVGLLPPLDAPHHLRKHEWAPYREGVTLKEKAPNSAGTMVDVGLSKNVVIDQVLEPGVRVTVVMGTNRNLDSVLKRQIVPYSKPREEEGTYWGYRVRYAPTIDSVFKDCPHKGGYDHLIGTSEHGLVIKSSELNIPSFRHLLIAFGGVAGLEESTEEENKYMGKNIRQVFDVYLNTCPHQGSRTIRTEEAIFISLQYFQEPISRSLEKS